MSLELGHIDMIDPISAGTFATGGKMIWQGHSKVNIETDLIATSWVTWEMRDLLTKAENLFGPRDPAFEYAGVAFSSEGPQTRFSPCETRICVELSSAALLYPDQLRYQGAHEVIHILAPSKPPAPMLEEGLAVWFAINGPNYGNDYPTAALSHLRTDPLAKNYADALALYNEVELLEKNCVARLRKREPSFVKMTPDLIRCALPAIDEQLANRCCERRKMR